MSAACRGGLSSPWPGSARNPRHGTPKPPKVRVRRVHCATPTVVSPPTALSLSLCCPLPACQCSTYFPIRAAAPTAGWVTPTAQSGTSNFPLLFCSRPPGARLPVASPSSGWTRPLHCLFLSASMTGGRECFFCARKFRLSSPSPIPSPSPLFILLPHHPFLRHCLLRELSSFFSFLIPPH